VTAAVAAFLDAKRTKGRAESTIESAEDRLSMIVGSLMQRPVRALNHRGAELYAAAQINPNDKPRAADTHQNALSVAKDFGAFCVKQRWLRVNPFADVEPVGRKVEGADKPRLTVDESRRLQTYCHEHAADLGAVITLAYLLLGSRASELVRRDVRDLDDGAVQRGLRVLQGGRQRPAPDPGSVETTVETHPDEGAAAMAK
jgi:site-specific recombinase XerD